MKFADSHAHIYLSQFKGDIESVIERSLDEGVEQVYMPNIDISSIDDMLETERKFPDICCSMIGLHPCSVDKEFERQLYTVESWIKNRDFAAIGEIGTDLFWDKTYWEQQQEAIRIQLGWAKEKIWPAVIHCRDSIEETITIVEQVNDKNLSGIFHCFTGTVEQARRITEMGFHLGIGGVSTFKNGGLEDVLKEIDLRYFVLETDSPYLAPTPHRGKRNEPAYIPLIAKRISELKKVDISQVAEVTTNNVNKIFTSYGL